MKASSVPWAMQGKPRHNISVIDSDFAWQERNPEKVHLDALFHAYESVDAESLYPALERPEP